MRTARSGMRAARLATDTPTGNLGAPRDEPALQHVPVADAMLVGS